MRALLASGIVLAAGSVARADGIDPTMPRTVLVGAPRGAAPSDRMDAQRTGRTREALPYPPVELWRRHVTGGVEVSPVVDAQGSIYVALTIPEVIKLGADGKEVWRTRLGPNGAVVAPLLTSDGTLVVITSAGQAWGISPAGSVRFTTSLGVRGRETDTVPLALRDGGLVIASGSTLLDLDRDGAIRARATLDPRVVAADGKISGALVAGPEGTLFTTDSGAVYVFRPPAAPRRLGSFGGAPRRGAVLADPRTLVAVVDNRRVVALDLPTGTTHVRSSSGPGSYFDGPVTIGKSLVLVAMQSGLLLGLDGAGNERVHIALEKLALGPDPNALASGGVTSFFAQTESKPSPPMIVDPKGRVAFARSGGRVGVVGPEGVVAVAGERVCSTPVAILPAGDRRMVLACRDGGLWLYGE